MFLSRYVAEILASETYTVVKRTPARGLPYECEMQKEDL
jgi:hypothetical protein